MASKCDIFLQIIEWFDKMQHATTLNLHVKLLKIRRKKPYHTIIWIFKIDIWMNPASPNRLQEDKIYRNHSFKYKGLLPSN